MQARNTYTSEYPAFIDVQNRENENIVILYGSSSDNEWRALALQTNQLVRRRERVGSLKTLADGDVTGYGMLQETSSGIQHEDDTTTDPSQDIFRIDSNKSETLAEFAIGVTTDDVYVGVENAGEVISGLQGDRARRETQPDDLDRHGIPSQLTLTNETDLPTTALSGTPDQGIVRIDSENNGRNPLRVAFNNEVAGAQRTVDVIVDGVSYRVTPVTDKGVVEDITYGKGHNRRVLTWSGFQNTSPNVPEPWKEGRIDITDEDVSSLLSEA